MNDESVKLICDSVADYKRFLASIRRYRREGLGVDVESAAKVAADILRDLVEECAVVSQGDDQDREDLCVRVARQAVQKIVGGGA
jgi:hypothetical protein